MKKFSPLVIALVLAACGDDTLQTTDDAARPQIAVTAAQPRLRQVDYVLTALGSIESLQSPTIAAETAGQVIGLTAQEGTAVTKGQVLVNLDATLHSIESAKAASELKRQEALTENQAREVARLKRLIKTKAVTEDHLEDQAAQLEALRGLRDMAQKQWEYSQYLESKTRVSAPLEGVVARRHVSIGDYVSVGQPLFDLVAVDVLRARFAFPEHHTSQIQTGKKVKLSSPANPTKSAEGVITAINPQIDAASRALEVIVEFKNPGGWLPGGSVDATLLVETHPEAITVPRLSVVKRDGSDTVFVTDNGRAGARRVQLGWHDTDWVEVISGIEPGDTVIVEGAALITNGTVISLEASR